MSTFSALRIWFQGKKTTIGGGLLIAAALAGAFTGKLGVLDCVTIAGFGISICGWSSKANRHQSEIMSAIQAAATAGVDLRLGNRAGALAALTPVVTQAIASSGPALSITVSGHDTAAVQQTVTSLGVFHTGGTISPEAKS